MFRHISSIVLSGLMRVPKVAVELLHDDVIEHLALVIQINRMEESEGEFTCSLRNSAASKLHINSTADACLALTRLIKAGKTSDNQRGDRVLSVQCRIGKILLHLHALEDVVALVRPPR